MIDGDVPVGAGLSSSAAVECAIAFALNELFNLQNKKEMVQMAQMAELFCGAKWHYGYVCKHVWEGRTCNKT